MFTAVIIDFPVYLRNILWEDKMTGHIRHFELKRRKRKAPLSLLKAVLRF